MKACVARLVCAYAMLAPGAVRAYSDPGMFGAPVLEGGGGGHYYSGSPAEGYVCSSCHAGGTAPWVQVRGLPARYVTGATYEFSLAWSPDIANVSGLMEVTDALGHGVGSLAMAGPNDLRDEEYCEPVSQQIAAGLLYAADGGRTIATLPDCGATLLRVQWTAPPSSIGPVWLAGSVVASDHHGDVAGDGVASFAQPIPAFGQKLPDAVAQAHCAVATAPGHAGRTSKLWLGWLGVVAISLLRRRHQGGLSRYASRLCGWLLFVGLYACGDEATVGTVALVRGGAVSPWDGGRRLSVQSDASLAPDASTLDATIADARSSADDAGLADQDAMPARVASAGAAAPRSVDAGPSAPVVFQVTTVSQGGSFAPKNVGAIWVADAGGRWVKTLAVWAGVSTRYLTSYCTANKTGNKVDAITSATLTQHKSHEVTWDLTDGDRKLVPDGSYRILVETTDHNSTGQLLTVPFTKGPMPAPVSPADSQYFHAVQLRFAGD